MPRAHAGYFLVVPKNKFRSGRVPLQKRSLSVPITHVHCSPCQRRHGRLRVPLCSPQLCLREPSRRARQPSARRAGDSPTDARREPTGWSEGRPNHTLLTHLCMSELPNEHCFRAVVCLEQSIVAHPSQREQRTKVQADTIVPAFHHSDCIGQMFATGFMKFWLL